MINWKVRIKSKAFWIAMISAIILIAQPVLEMFGVSIDALGMQEQLINIVNAVFGALVALGVVVDPTTAGVGDSARAMTYQAPRSELDEVYVDNRMDPEDFIEE
jgi:phi LC3 family holin